MSLEKVVFGFFVLLAATLNFGFFIGDIADPRLHNVYDFFAAVVVNLITTGLKFGDRTSPAIENRMRAFGSPTVVNPFDRFGDHVRLALHAPASYQLMSWLVGGPDADLPARGRPPRTGRWVVCGFGRFGHELVEDLRADGLEISVIDLDPDPGAPIPVIKGDASEPEVMALARLEDAAAFVAGTDTTNLSLIAAARRVDPGLFVAARQNQPASAPLFAAMRLDWLLVPAEVVGREIYAQLSSPLRWRLLREMPARGDDEWAARMVDRLHQHCGDRLGDLWKVMLTQRETPALLG